MATYLGSYPPHVPRSLLAALLPLKSVVLDPFCGSGTTLLEARLLGHEAIGVDRNPLAVAIARGKNQAVAIDDVEFRLTELARSFPGLRALHDVPDSLHTIYHERTLAQLCHLREELDPETPEDAFLLGALLGIMHGKWRRDGSTAYLSIDMPNTFSMSPAYVERFVSKHELKKPAVDAFANLRQRARWLLRKGAIPVATKCSVLGGDATQLSTVIGDSQRERIGCILTSPPYLGVLRYGAFNWIRLWLLRCDPKEVDSVLDSTDSLDRYLSFFATFLHSASKVLAEKSLLIAVVGDVVERGQHVPLAERVWEEVEGIAPFRLREVLVDHYDADRKTTRIWGEEKKGRATPLDRVLILERVAGKDQELPAHSGVTQPAKVMTT
jgi:site-specific DNA-methyltransferase (adenine-specific)